MLIKNHIYLKKYFPVFIFVFISVKIFSQSNITVLKNIRPALDSTSWQGLISDLNSFINLGESDSNKFITNTDKAATYDLMDELKDITQKGVYKPYLNNVVPIENNKYLIQFSYIGNADSASVLNALFTLIGTKEPDNKFTFSSPVNYNSRYWKVQKIGNVNFHFQENLNQAEAAEFNSFITEYNKKLGVKDFNVEYYCCANSLQGMQLLGVDYKLAYNGIKSLELSSSYNTDLIIVSSEGNAHFDSFNRHDLWHYCLHSFMDINKINRPVDEGCAYLYGGSWGMSWNKIYSLFYAEYGSKKNADWLNLYQSLTPFKPANPDESQRQPLFVPYVINALIVQKLEKEKGFDAVKQLLSCGHYTKDNQNYFDELNTLMKINRQNFNVEIQKLVDEEYRKETK